MKIIKIIISVLFISLFNLTFSTAEDCSKYDKLTKDYAQCTSDKFKKETHLPGSDNAGVDELLYYYDNDYSFIRSNDTSMPFVYGYNGKKIKDGRVSNIIMEKLDFDKQLSHLEIQTVDDNFVTWRTLHVN